MSSADDSDSVAESGSGLTRDQYAIVGSVIASTFFVGFGGGVIFPILPNLGAVLGISPFFVGLILSANRFSRLVASAPAGSLVDRVGTRTPFIVGLFIQAVATFGYVIAYVAPFPEPWFLLTRILWGVGSALVFATAYTIAADVSRSGSRGTSMGLGRCRRRYRQSPWGCRRLRRRHAVCPVRDSSGLPVRPRNSRRRRHKQISETLGDRPERDDTHHRAGEFHDPLWLRVAAVGFLVLAMADSVPLLILACVLIGSGQGGTSGPLVALLADLTPSDQMGRATGTNNVLGDVGGGLGPLISLPLINLVGFTPIYAACALLPLAAGVILLIGIHYETGRLFPETDYIDVSTAD